MNVRVRGGVGMEVETQGRGVKEGNFSGRHTKPLRNFTFRSNGIYCLCTLVECEPKNS